MYRKEEGREGKVRGGGRKKNRGTGQVCKRILGMKGGGMYGGVKGVGM